jgi:hypothetical protein
MPNLPVFRKEPGPPSRKGETFDSVQIALHPWR